MESKKHLRIRILTGIANAPRRKNMSNRLGIAVLSLLALNVGTLCAEPADSIAICRVEDASPAEKLAAKEVRRYIYLRTGKLLPILDTLSQKPDGGLIVIGVKDQPVVQSLLSDATLKATIDGLTPEQYAIKTLNPDGRPILIIVGGDAIGTLYGAYRFAEHLGVRFYLHGDVVPDRRIALALPRVDEVRKPLFELRGILPFHDFPEGPDWWSRDGYKAILGQLPKMGMNFFGLHTYPEGGIGPEPLVWIGPPEGLSAKGRVKASYPARHFTTDSEPPAWGFVPGKTSDYFFGAAEMFDRDNYGADYMRDVDRWNKMSLEQCNALFGRMGEFLNDVFTYARNLGIKTCVGTEAPLKIPTAVKERLQAAGKNTADPAVVQEMYEGIFQRIARTHPLDYYWLWTPENWTWEAVKQEQIDSTLMDLNVSLAAAKKTNAPFTLATSGWVLGPPQNPTLFDASFPKTMPMSCINRSVGNTPVEPGFANIEGRPKWAIPWLEDDTGMTIPQLWAGRMRKDAADALKYGCTGLMGIHWRTRILGPNVSALAQAAWDQSTWNAERAQAPTARPTTTTEGVTGGQTALFPARAIAEADDISVYQSVRYDVKSYRISVPNGVYNVTLKLCEPHYNERGKRIFGAKVQDRLLFEHLDIFAKVGKNRAMDVTAKDVKIIDGRLMVQFLYEVEFPCIAGIAIEGTAAATNQFASRPYRRKINCGGQAHGDYEADMPTVVDHGASRYLPTADFYAGWAQAEFGPEAANPIASIFTRLDGQLPRPADWVTGPGSIKPDARPWQQVKNEYLFVDELASLRPKIVGIGNLERFDYWLNILRYLRSIAKVNCFWARFNNALDKVVAEKDPKVQRRLAEEHALPRRIELVTAFTDLHRHLLATVSSLGEMGNVSNWQQQTLPVLLTEPGKRLATLLKKDLPAEAVPTREFSGEPRLFVPEVRTRIMAGETLRLTVILLGMKPQELEVFWRPLGTGPFSKMHIRHVVRGVYAVVIPAQSIQSDFEYYVQAKKGNKSLVFPTTAPMLNQTVVVTE